MNEFFSGQATSIMSSFCSVSLWELKCERYDFVLDLPVA